MTRAEAVRQLNDGGGGELSAHLAYIYNTHTRISL